MSIRRIARHQRGDTLIEVMVALAILAAVIAGGYSIATRSVRGARMSQERTEAVKVVENQMEVLRDYAGRYTDADINPANPALSKNIFINNTFCIDPRTQNRIVWPTGDPSAISHFDDNFAAYPATCITQDGRYHISIRRNGDIFTARARWDRIGGGRDEVRIVYRLYKPAEFESL